MKETTGIVTDWIPREKKFGMTDKLLKNKRQDFNNLFFTVHYSSTSLT